MSDSPNQFDQFDDLAETSDAAKDDPIYDPPSRRAIDLADKIDEILANVVPDLPAIDAAIVDEILSNVIWSGSKSRFFFLNEDQTAVAFMKVEAWPMICRRFGWPIDLEAVNRAFPANMTASQHKAAMKEIRAIIGSIVRDDLQYCNQRERFQWLVDPFAKVSRVRIGEVIATFTLTHRQFQTGPIDAAVVMDFQEHFPEFDQVLRWIAASRFAGDRKKAFLWLLCASDFGKGLILGLLKDLGAVVEMSVKEIEGAFEGKPLGKSPEDFTRAWVLWIDEFKSVKSELKQIQSELTLSPKYQLTATVKIYAKIFTSAENVSSLTTEAGVEDQFANRMNLLEGSARIVDRPLYRSNRATYAASLRNHMAATLNRHAIEFVAMGRQAASNAASEELEAFAVLYGIGNTHGRVGDNIVGIGVEFRQWALCKTDHDQLREFLKYQQDCSVILTSPAKVLSDYLKDRFDPSQLTTLLRRSSDIIKAADVEGKKARPIKAGGVVFKAIRLSWTGG